MNNADSQLSDAKRALLAKYLRGDIPKTNLDSYPAGLANRGTTPVPPSDESRITTITIQAQGNRVPFFFPHVHWEGGAAYCFSLSRELGPDQPFYLMEPYRLNDLQIPPTLMDIAAECVRSIRAIQPQGPYRLGGYCGAGFIIYEMAQQLQAAGQQVEALVMIEPGVGPYFAQLLGWVGHLVTSVGTTLHLTPDQQLSWFLYMRHVYKLARYPKYRSARKITLASTREALREDWLGTFVWIVSTYAPRPYDGKVTYIWAQDDSGSQREWWRRTFVARETEDHFTAGNRSNCRSTYVDDLGVQLRACLEEH